tara:strand:+ start:950 stop:1315 length:366 start_codon:yes stop_codon:yes gene_type:complete
MKNFLLIIFFSLITTNLTADKNIQEKILKNIRCLVCQGQTISDSNSDFAQTIKSVVQDKIQEGLTEKEVYKFLSDKYGDWILFNPPLKNTSYVLWFLPYLLFIFGGLIIFFMIKKTLVEKK